MTESRFREDQSTCPIEIHKAVLRFVRPRFGEVVGVRGKQRSSRWQLLVFTRLNERIHNPATKE